MPNPFTTPDETIIREKIPVFATRRIVSVTEAQKWTPLAGDKAFYASVDTTYTLGEATSESVYVSLMQGQVVGIVPGMTFTFTTTTTLAVM